MEMWNRMTRTALRWHSRWLDWQQGLTVPELEAGISSGLGLSVEDRPSDLPPFPPNALRDASALSRGVQGLADHPVIQEFRWDRQVGALQGGLAGGAQVVPLGTHCFTAALLKRWGWRRQAGPFDWLFTTLPMITHMIEDDFERFLDPAEYRPVPEPDRKAGVEVNRVNHAYYHRQFGVEHVFNHHDVHLPADYQHFVRAVERFRSLLASDEAKLFLAFRWHETGFEHELEGLHRALASRTRRFALHVVAVDALPSERVLPQLEHVVNAEGYGAWIFRSVSHWGPLAFSSKLDELCLHRAVQTMRETISAERA